MRKLNSVLGLMLLMILLTSFFVININGCSESTCQSATPTAPYRFQYQGRFRFAGSKEMRASIYLDTVTDIKYLYIWDGMSSGGPAITRLWEKEEKK